MPRVEKRLIAGAAGAIELTLDWPDALPAPGWALIGHPHPLYGGTMDNKVAATIARTFAGMGWLAVRFNFRGVGASGGTHDGGRRSALPWRRCPPGGGGHSESGRG